MITVCLDRIHVFSVRSGYRHFWNNITESVTPPFAQQGLGGKEAEIGEPRDFIASPVDNDPEAVSDRSNFLDVWNEGGKVTV